MSGGYFDCTQGVMLDIADAIERAIASDNVEFQPQTIGILKTAVRVLKMAHVYTQRVDWLLSDDDGEESFLRRLAEDCAKLIADNPP